jgi:hypothetical protein
MNGYLNKQTYSAKVLSQKRYSLDYMLMSKNFSLNLRKYLIKLNALK